MSRIIKNLKYTGVYFALISILCLALLLLFYLFSFFQLPFWLAFTAAVIISLCLLISLGNIRDKELTEIQKVISSIAEKKFAGLEEIKLDANLAGLQEEIKKMYMVTEKDIAYLKRLEKVRTEFLGNVSHELRTPIFAIQGYLETLLDGALYDEKVNRNFLNKANHHIHNLNNLINDLIDISMIESGEMHLSYRYFELEPFITEVIQDLRPLASEKELDIILHPVKSGLQVFGDKNKLRQVFVNLIQNSIKYTENGKVEVIVSPEMHSVRITIKDTGIGISEKDIPRIFERFYRVDKDRSRQAGGTGLGLAIVKHIVEAHESKVEVKSRIGEGSEFSFRLKI